jgi:UDP-N-acetylglucosamine--N-acetylmuramyl-(pentapeptide) pyrophosphoryl-undecaprenol N-acetylglucosamine transferase
MGQYFPQEKLHFTGNPVRQDIIGLEGKRAEALAHFGLEAGRPVLLVLGGSLGARTLNEALLSGIDRLAGAGLQVVWQTGKYYYESVRQRLGAERPGVKVMPFVARMDLAYACADAVVSRAGALSISELCVAGKPAILVPSPNVTADHQTKNALALVQEQAAWLVADADAPEQLLPKVLELMADAPAREALALNIKKLGKPDAARHIAEQVRRLAGCLN